MNEEKKSVTSNRCNSPASDSEAIRSNGFNGIILCGLGAENIDIQSFINEYINAIISVEGKSVDETHCNSTNGDAFWDIFNIIHGFLGFDIGFVSGVGGICNKYSDTEIQDFNMALDSTTLVEQQQQWHQLQQRQPVQLQPLHLGSDDNKVICNGNTIGQKFQLNHNGYDSNSSGNGGDGVAVCYLFSKEKMLRVTGKIQLFMAPTPSLDIQNLVALSPHVYNNDNTANTGNNGNNMNDNNGHGIAIVQRTSLLQSHLNRMDEYFLSQGLDMYKIMMNNNEQQELIQYLIFGFMFDKNVLRDVTWVSVLAVKPNRDMPEETGSVRFNFVRNFGNKIGECQVELNVGRGYKAVISLRLRWE